MIKKLVAVAALAGLSLVSACASSKSGDGHYSGPSDTPDFGSKVTVFDERKMAQDIEHSQQGSALGAVTCPANEVVQKGRTFDCSAGNNVTIHIKVRSNDGDYTWTPSQG